MAIKLCALAMVTLTVLMPLSMAQGRMARPNFQSAQAITLDPVVVTPKPPTMDQCGGLGGGEGRDESNNTFDDRDFQLEGKESDETEGMDDEAYERDFDVSAEDTKISEEEMQKHISYLARREPKASADARKMATNVAELSPYHHYNIYGALVMYKCCPRRQGYGCRSIRRPLGCFRKFGNQVCCPIWPQNLYMAYCNCHKCVQLTPYCATCGTCQRRYRSVKLWAVCRVIPNGTWNVQQMVHAVPTSCYCRTNNWSNPWVTSELPSTRG